MHGVIATEYSLAQPINHRVMGFWALAYRVAGCVTGGKGGLSQPEPPQGNIQEVVEEVLLRGCILRVFRRRQCHDRRKEFALLLLYWQELQCNEGAHSILVNGHLLSRGSRREEKQVTTISRSRWLRYPIRPESKSPDASSCTGFCSLRCWQREKLPSMQGERKKIRESEGAREWESVSPTQRECNWNGYKSRSRTIVFPRLYLQCILVSAAAAAAAYVSLIKPLGPSLRMSPWHSFSSRSHSRSWPLPIQVSEEREGERKRSVLIVNGFQDPQRERTLSYRFTFQPRGGPTDSLARTPTLQLPLTNTFVYIVVHFILFL